MDGHEDSPLLARVVAEFPEIFRHEILPLLVGSGGLPDMLEYSRHRMPLKSRNQGSQCVR
jgi:hypothetical protein